MTLFFINIGKTWIWTLMSIRVATAAPTTGWMHLPVRRGGRQGRHWLSFPSLCIYTACPHWGGSFLQILPGNAVTHPSWGRPFGSSQILSNWQSRWTVTSTLQKICNTCMELRHMSPHMLNTPCITHEPQGYVNTRKNPCQAALVNEQWQPKLCECSVRCIFSFQLFSFKLVISII